MIRFIKACLPLVLVLLADGLACGEEKPKTRILFLGKNPDHPYGAHMYMHTCGILAKCVELTPGIETIVSNGWPKDAKMLEGVKVIVVYTSPAAELLLEGPHRGQVDELMKKGVGLVTIHWASSINKSNLDRLGPTWLSYLGGTWVSNVGLSGGKSPLKQLIPDHPICRGWSEYEIEDEYYLNPVIKQAKPLLQVKERKGTDIVVGWAFERPGGGRSFGTTLGHPYKNFQIEAFRRMIVNAILWSAQMEIPKEGAPVNLKAEALALPPEKKPADAPKPTLEEAVRKWREGFASTKKEEQQQVVRSMLPTRKDIEYLFPKHAAKLWPLVEKENARWLENADKVAEEMTRRGPIKAVIAHDARKDKELTKRYKQLLELIPKDLPVFQVTVEYDRSSSGGGTYLFRDGRWFFIRDLDTFPEILDQLK